MSDITSSSLIRLIKATIFVSHFHLTQFPQLLLLYFLSNIFQYIWQNLFSPQYTGWELEDLNIWISQTESIN